MLSVVRPTLLTQVAGRENEGTGLYFYRARYYSPLLGRFINEDPIGLGGGLNTYSYAFNSPTNLIDPSGNCPILCEPHSLGKGLLFSRSTLSYVTLIAPRNNI
jgi:RHS repeat-associated protein